MRQATRKSLIRAIKGSIGRLDEHGIEVPADDEARGVPQAPSKRPTAAQKKKVVAQMLEIDQQKRGRS